MWETPPYSIEEFRLKLSEQLENLLSADETAELDDLCRAFPAFEVERAKFLSHQTRLKASMSWLAASAPHSSFPQKETESGDYWKSLSAALQADANCPLIETDWEFISAYYDGELDTRPTERHQFESQLYQNEPANRHLADIDGLSTAIRMLAFRQEQSCTLNLTTPIMAILMDAYETCSAAAPTMSNSIPMTKTPATDLLNDTQEFTRADLSHAQLETLSGAFDQELSPKDRIIANTLIEQNDTAKATLSEFSALSDHLHQYSLALQESAPDLLNKLRPALEADAKATHAALPFYRRQSFQSFAVPMAAAVLLAVVAIPSLQSVMKPSASSVTAPQSASPLMNTASASTQPKATDRPAKTIATAAPHRIHFKNNMHKHLSLFDTISSNAPHFPLKPILVSQNRTLASHKATKASDMADANDVGASPSSDEFLFHALNEAPKPDGELSNNASGK